MKNILFLLALLVAGTATAQDYKVSKTTGTLLLVDLNNVSVEGHPGNEIIFTSVRRDRDRDDRAAGLRAISSGGLEDNTGLGLSVIEKNEVIEVHQLKKMDGPRVTIKVPKGVRISYVHTTPHGSDFVVQNFEGSLDVSSVHTSVMLTHVTGPLQIKTVHGDIDVIMGTTLSNAATIASVHGHVDVAIPPAARLNLILSTNWGEIFVDPDLKIDVQSDDSMRRYSSKIRGTLNGGGTALELESGHSNVYLRKRP